MSKLPPWSKFHWGDFEKRTSYLNGEFKGTYLNLLRIYLGQHGPLPNDEDRIFFLAGVTDEGQRQIIRLVLKFLFTLDDDGLLHDEWADSLIDVATKESGKQRHRAKKGLKGRKRGPKGRWLSKVPKNSGPAVAGGSPAVASGDPAILDTKNQEPRYQEPKSLDMDICSLKNIGKDSCSLDTASVKVSHAVDVPAPPKQLRKVGADIENTNHSTTVGQLPAEQPALPPLTAEDLERLRWRQENDAGFAALPFWMRAMAITDRENMGGFVLTPEERECDESRRVAAMFEQGAGS